MAVVELQTTNREPYAGGRQYANSGSYERIDGVLVFAVDPEHRANLCIVDLDLAPRGTDGRVRFRSDFTLLVPRDPDLGNRRLFVDVVNRGRARLVSRFNRAQPPPEGSRDLPDGDGFLFRRGYAVVSIGWQWDVHRGEGMLGLEAPQAQIDGGPVRGQTYVEIRPSEVEHTRLLSDRRHKSYPVADLNDPDALLLVRDWEDGPDTVIRRSEWRFAMETANGIVASHEHVYLESGFQPGKIYYSVFTTQAAPVVGTGLLAVRDVAAWLRHPSDLNPIKGGIERSYAYGSSQGGRLLRHFVYLGLNLDEEGRTAYDGLIPHIAGGRRGEFNHRFAQPSTESPSGFGHLFPFADNELFDPFTGRKDGLLKRQRELGGVPKIIYTNSSSEYWRGEASLTHIDPHTQRDIEPASETRSYHLAGTQHVSGSLSLQFVLSLLGAPGRYPLNVVDYQPLLRAALVNLDQWVIAGVEPPPSKHPRLDDGTAVTRSEVLASFDAAPDMVKPDPERLWLLRVVDMGPGADQGIGRYPVQEGATYHGLVSPVDSDGNELAGIRLPDLEVPVGTHTGWNPRTPESGAPELLATMQGLSMFFPATGNQRQETGDSRLSIEERYQDRESYLEQVRDAALRLVAQRYLLEEDLEVVVAACTERYDAALAAAGTSAVGAAGDDG